jgi:hypothetical protein
MAYVARLIEDVKSVASAELVNNVKYGSVNLKSTDIYQPE